tara:strand:+ start:254 stop:772 length:519 start_codon:yes stop_codon:yes gene_type:complete
MIAKTLSRLGIEVWKDILDFDYSYQVSNLGNVRNINYRNTNKTKEMKKTLDSGGRYAVSLYKNKKGYTKRVHKLVAIYFLGHKPCGHTEVIDHIDNNPLNNKLYNLQRTNQRVNTSKDKKGGTSKYIGVSWYKNCNKWVSKIEINGKGKTIGYFADEKEAAQAYINELNKIK